MKSRPILFSASMIRALLAGTKTQTRRTVKGSAMMDSNGFMPLAPDLAKCPYGQPGDTLWCRETFLPKSSGTIYRADYSELEAAGLGGLYGGWKPSIHIPRALSRITLEIVSVRVERLNDISEEDAKAEGVMLPARTCTMYDGIWRDGYQELWEKINGPGSWVLNPWIWVVGFSRINA